MIIYRSNASEFRKSVESNTIVDIIENAFIRKFGRYPGGGEKTAWTNSLQFMETIVRNSHVADDCGVLIEYNIPGSSKRIDFIITGLDERSGENFIIIELKQWSSAEATEKEDVVRAFVGHKTREMAHPSYQAWSYKEMLTDMNEAIYTGNISSYACSYLHNYQRHDPEPLTQKQYESIISQSPIFFKSDYQKLQDYLYKRVGRGNGLEIMRKIETGRIKPSKKLIEHLEGVFKGNQEFILIDEQKVAYSTIISLASRQDQKRTIIVKGGPGTGKSVVSINAFVELIRRELNVKFVAPNQSFRTVMVETLVMNARKGKGRIRNLFSGSSQFYHAAADSFDVLVVDEAHRLKGAGAYNYVGNNQIDDIIKASKVNVFFIDDDQCIRPEDIGSVKEIRRVAAQYGSEVSEIKLEAQFRCSGAEGFINWLDTVLQIRDTANFDGWDNQAFEFGIFDNPHDLLAAVREKNEHGHKARMLAGFAWKWTSESEGNKNGEVEDVVIPEYEFAMPWNGRSISTTWAISDEGINQVGCIHTSQGLEFDYVGVIIGNDLKFDPKTKKVYASYDDYKDTVGKKGLKFSNGKLTQLVANIYKVLMSRGMKGCYIFCLDPELQAYFKERLDSIGGD